MQQNYVGGLFTLLKIVQIFTCILKKKTVHRIKPILKKNNVEEYSNWVRWLDPYYCLKTQICHC